MADAAKVVPTKAAPKPYQIAIQVGGDPPLGNREDQWGTPVWIPEECIKHCDQGQDILNRIWTQGYFFKGRLAEYGRFGGHTITIWELRQPE